MYLGSNKIALQSRDWIAQSFIELLNNIDYSKITINNICEYAKVSRQTFYNLYSNKEDILHFILREKYIYEFEKLQNYKTIELDEVLTIFTKIINNNRELLKLFINNNLSGIIFDELTIGISLFLNTIIKTEQNNKQSYGIAFLSGALANILIYWIKDKNPLPSKELKSILEKIFNGKFYPKMDI